MLDTWFSSWLWPIAVFDTTVFKDPANKGNRDLNYYNPTNDLVTAPEILFFWVARMIIAGYEYRGKMPFKNVYLTGIVRDKLGRKMSKSLGNSPDPLDLIANFGADAVRVGMLFSSPAGNDLLYDEKLHRARKKLREQDLECIPVSERLERRFFHYCTRRKFAGCYLVSIQNG